VARPDDLVKGIKGLEPIAPEDEHELVGKWDDRGPESRRK